MLRIPSTKPGFSIAPIYFGNLLGTAGWGSEILENQPVEYIYIYRTYHIIEHTNHVYTICWGHHYWSWRGIGDSHVTLWGHFFLRWSRQTQGVIPSGHGLLLYGIIIIINIIATTIATVTVTIILPNPTWSFICNCRLSQNNYIYICIDG